MTTKKLIITSFAVFLITTAPVYALEGTPAGRLGQGMREELKQAQASLRSDFKQKLASLTAQFRLFRNGHIAIANGEITAINGTTLTVTKDSKTYTVHTDGNTKFRRKFWGTSNLTEFSVGDKVNIIGSWEDDAKTTIKALLIRDISIQKRHGVFFGSITAKSDTGFTLASKKRGDQAVTVASDTKYVNRKEETITFNDLAVGQQIRVRGLWDSTHATITEVAKIKDFSLPPRPSTPSASK